MICASHLAHAAKGCFPPEVSIVASKGREIRDCSKRIDAYDKESRYDKSVFQEGADCHILYLCNRM
jgi:hypothetical protein